MADIYISTVAEFLDIPSHSENDNFFLQNDIDFNGININLGTFEFKGIWNGQGYELSNIEQTQAYIFYKIDSDFLNTNFRNVIFNNVSFVDGTHFFSIVSATSKFQGLAFYNTLFKNLNNVVGCGIIGFGFPVLFSRVKIDNWDFENPKVNFSNIGRSIITVGESSISENTLIEEVEATNISLYGTIEVGLIGRMQIVGTASISVNIVNCKIEYKKLIAIGGLLEQKSGGIVGRIEMNNPNALFTIENNLVHIEELRLDGNGAVMVGEYAGTYITNLHIKNNATFARYFYTKINDDDRHSKIADTLDYLAPTPFLELNFYYKFTEHYYLNPSMSKVPINYNVDYNDIEYTSESSLYTQELYDEVSFDFINIWDINESNSLPFLRRVPIPPTPGIGDNYIKINGEWKVGILYYKQLNIWKLVDSVFNL